MSYNLGFTSVKQVTVQMLSRNASLVHFQPGPCLCSFSKRLVVSCLFCIVTCDTFLPLFFISRDFLLCVLPMFLLLSHTLPNCIFFSLLLLFLSFNFHFFLSLSFSSPLYPLSFLDPCIQAVLFLCCTFVSF